MYSIASDTIIFYLSISSFSRFFYQIRWCFLDYFMNYDNSAKIKTKIL